MHHIEERFQRYYKNLVSLLKQLNIPLHITGNIDTDIEHIFKITIELFVAKNTNKLKLNLGPLEQGSQTQQYNIIHIILTDVLLYKYYGKNIYDIDTELTKLLSKASFKGKIPSSYLFMPKFPFFAINFLMPNDSFSTYYITFKTDDDYKCPSITITDEKSFKVSIPLIQDKTLEECISIAFKDEVSLVVKESNLIVNTLLYILGDKDTVKEIHPGSNPKRKSYINPVYGKSPNVYKVGDRYRKLIERYELDGLESHKENELSGRTVRPHIRSAHQHLYWTGQGRTIPIVKLVMSCLVNGKIINFTDMEEDLTDVK